MAEKSSKKNLLHSSNRQKKSKADLIRAAVGHYLKHKGHMGTEKIRKSDYTLLQNKKQFLFNKMVEGDLTKGNSFVYSNVLSINNNHHIVDQQFSQFSQFIEIQSEYTRDELRRFYAPIICHFYMELLKVDEPKAAMEFLKKNAHLIAPVDNYEAPLSTKINGCSVAEAVAVGDREDLNNTTVRTQIKFTKMDTNNDDVELIFFTKLIQILSIYSNYETAENNEDVRLFRSAKFELYMTSQAFNILRDYLQQKGHVFILNLIYTWMHIHIIDNEIQRWSEDYLFFGADENDDEMFDDLIMTNSKQTNPLLSKNNTRRKSEDANNINISPAKDDTQERVGCDRKISLLLKTMHDSGGNFLQAQTTLPRFVKVADKCRGLTSADIDKNACHLVAGFNSSVIQLWQMNQCTVRGKNLYRSYADSVCKWELSNTANLEENDNDDDDDDGDGFDNDEIGRSIKLEHTTDSDRLQCLEAEYMSGKYADNSINDFGGIQLRGHNRGVTDVRFSAHYPLLYSVSKDGTMRTWRAATYTCDTVYRGHNYPIWCVDESPAGMYTATGSRDLTARLWSLERDFPLITYVGHTQDVECLAFHPNGNYIASGSADLSVRLWCVTSGKLMRVFSDCKQPVTALAFSPDGKLLAAGGEETRIRIFDLAAGAQLTELKDLTARCTSLAWNVNGQSLAAVMLDGAMRLWNVSKLNTKTEHGDNTTTIPTASSASLSANCLMALSSNSQRLVKVLFSYNETLSCIGN